MNLNVPFTNHGLKDSEISLLRKGNIQSVSDLILVPVQDIAKRCRASPVEIKRIIDTVLSQIPQLHLERLDALTSEGDELFSTGDAVLDKALEGGIRTGMVWEVVGERLASRAFGIKKAGKTQFALRLSLFVQAPREQGGLSGSCCYITTSAKLPTGRLAEMVDSDDILSTFCGLDDVQTMSAPTAAMLQTVLSSILPAFVQKRASERGSKPVKLLVIDALGELFHSNAKTTSSTLIERAKDIALISASLHQLATVHKMAIVVLNEVIDRFDHPTSGDTKNHAGISYSSQSRWFNTAEFFGARTKEASLGLVWANQVNARIMLTRTGRRKYFDLKELAKRRRVGPSTNRHSALNSSAGLGQDEPQSISIRRLSVIFSSVCSPVSLDYIITAGGIAMLEPEVETPVTRPSNRTNSVGQDSKLSEGPAILQSLAPATSQPESDPLEKEEVQEEDDYLWENAEDFDFDALEQTLSQLGQ